jgi:glycosyltransferase involved in cell wall biosynthesis
MTDLEGKHTLYICYFGLRQPLVQTQVIPYLRELATGGLRVTLLTFEPEPKKSWTPAQIEEMRVDLLSKNIQWSALAYHKRPSAIATAYDIIAAARHIRKLIDADEIDVLHGRVHVATLMGALARRFARRKPKLIFDIRGFFPEEYTDAGVWPENGTLYRSAKRVERWLLSRSDAFVVLTEKAREVLFPGSKESGRDINGRPVEVIQCCVDLETRFRSELSDRETLRKKLGYEGRFVAAHVGALGGLYLTREIVDFLVAARERHPTLFALFLTQTDPGPITQLLQENGFSQGDYFVGRVDSSKVPEYLEAADIGLSFVKATYATLSRSPTKIPEYLAAGLPIIANPGVGDVDELVTGEGVGVLIEEFNRESYMQAIDRLAALGDISEKCRETAARRFDLKTVGGPLYRRLYERLFCIGPD